MSDGVLGRKAIVDSCAIMPLLTVAPVPLAWTSVHLRSDCDRRSLANGCRVGRGNGVPAPRSIRLCM